MTTEKQTPANTPRVPEIQWDESQAQTHYVNVCNVMGTREEMAMLFGKTEVWQHDAAEVTVKLTHRMVMSPYAAKRCMLLLQQAVKNYENRYGELKLTP